MTAIYTFDVFSSLDGFGAPTTAIGEDTGESKDPNCSTADSPCTARSRGWSLGRTPIGNSCKC